MGAGAEETRGRGNKHFRGWGSDKRRGAGGPEPVRDLWSFLCRVSVARLVMSASLAEGGRGGAGGHRCTQQPTRGRRDGLSPPTGLLPSEGQEQVRGTPLRSFSTAAWGSRGRRRPCTCLCAGAGGERRKIPPDQARARLPPTTACPQGQHRGRAPPVRTCGIAFGPQALVPFDERVGGRLVAGHDARCGLWGSRDRVGVVANLGAVGVGERSGAQAPAWRQRGRGADRERGGCSERVCRTAAAGPATSSA